MDAKAYIDTIVICTCTAIIIAGLYDTDADGLVLTMRSLEAEIGLLGPHVICNVTAILLLSPKAIWLLRDYRRQKNSGAEPEFHKSEMPGDVSDIECWD